MKTNLFCFLYLLSLISYGQGLTNLWILGYDAGAGPGFGTTNIDFNYTPKQIYQFDRPMNFMRTNTSMCDSAGNLLFYSNGIYIANRFDDTLFNGTNFNMGPITTLYYPGGMPIPQGILAIPAPSEINKYYIFSVSGNVFMNTITPIRLICSFLDMSLDSGRGGLVWKNTTKINAALSSGLISACKHANGRDWWVTAHKFVTGGIYKLLVTPQGISSPTLQTIAQPYDTVRGVSQSVYSPDGTKYALYDPYSYLEIFDFDRCSGNFSNPLYLDLNDNTACGGIAFSPNSRFLYVASTNYIYQFDMQAANVLASKDTVAVWDSSYIPSFPFATTFALMQLAPDGKIYLNSCNGTNILHVINNPDSAGTACDVCQHCVNLPTYISFAIPNFPNYFLGADTSSICDTLQVSIIKNRPLSSIQKLSLFPNPVQQNLHLTYTPQAKAQLIEIIDATGKIVLQSNLAPWSQQQTIDASSLHDGMYLCRLGSQFGQVNLKFVIQKKE
ncbi:MAG TPA: T9SS type A sorting domain-containing protein [Bacteroidia bacterium]|nr:T9SS type A sorting domain-containing protein [Bacteroidia bacterium]